MNIAGARLTTANYQNENVVGLSNQRHKIGFRAIVFRKKNNRWEKT